MKKTIIPEASILLCITNSYDANIKLFVEQLIAQMDLIKPINYFQISQEVDLGKESDDYLIWLVMKTILQGQVPLLITDGSTLFTNTKKPTCVLRNKIKSAIGIDFKMITYVASPENEICVLKIIKPTSDIMSKIMMESDMSYLFPQTCNPDQALSFGDFVENIIIPKDNLTARFTQIRYLVQIDNNFVGHITWSFNPKRPSYTLQDLEEISAMYEKVFIGKYHTLTSIDSEHSFIYNKINFIFATPDKAVHSDMSTHITIDSGPHAAKETGTIVRAMMRAETETYIICLPAAKSQIQYDLTKIQSVPCIIKKLDVFGIP